MNRVALILAGCLLLLAIIPTTALSADSASARPTDSAAIAPKDTATADSIVLQPNRVIVYYFHGNRRYLPINRRIFRRDNRERIRRRDQERHS
jgi:hypothetical protein